MQDNTGSNQENTKENNLNQETKQKSKKKQSRLFKVFPLIAIGYIMVCSSLLTRKGLDASQQKKEIETENTTFENVVTPFERFTDGKTVNGEKPKIKDIHYETNEEGIITAAEITMNEPVSAFVEIAPSYFGKYKGNGLVPIASDSLKIRFSNEEIKELVKSDVTGILEGVFPVQIYVYKDDGNTVSEPTRFSVFNDKRENLMEIREFIDVSKTE